MMKRCVLGMVLAAMLLPAAAVVGQEFEELEHDPEYQMEMQERQMELEGRQAKIEAERRMADLELAKRKMELAQMDKAHRDGPGLLLLVIAVVNILCAVWVFQDIRQRACGSGIWIVIALLAGLLGTLVYAVVRIGDTGNNKKKA